MCWVSESQTWFLCPHSLDAHNLVLSTFSVAAANLNLVTARLYNSDETTVVQRHVCPKHTPVHMRNSFLAGTNIQGECRRKCEVCNRRIHFMCHECNVPLCVQIKGKGVVEDSCWYIYHASLDA